MFFLGCLYNKKEERHILLNSKSGMQNAANTFQWNLIEGLVECIEDLKIINVLPVGTWPKKYKKLFLRTKKWEFNNQVNYEIGCLNLPFIKQIYRYIKLKKLLKDITDNNIIIYSTYLPFLKAIYKLGKEKNITLIVTDLPEYYDLNKVSLIKKYLRKINNFFIYRYIKRIDKFVLLTDYMKTPLKVENRPYIVIEGISNSGKYNTIEKEKVNENFIIFYSGTLNFLYGIKNLVNAFKEIYNKDMELWIAGCGESETLIKESSLYDKRIKYFGYITKDEVNKLQSQANLLVNPRQNLGEYTKYSFPSKTIEYMESGVPVLMYKLDGIPDDYDNYLYYIKDNTIESLKNKISEISNLPKEELISFGNKAKEFVHKEKNNFKQAKKIIDFIYR